LYLPGYCTEDKIGCNQYLIFDSISLRRSPTTGLLPCRAIYLFIFDVTAKSNKTVKTHSFKQDKLCRIAKYYRDIESNIRANFKFGGFANCLNQMTVFASLYSLEWGRPNFPVNILIRWVS
jgi:hypothetical protein